MIFAFWFKEKIMYCYITLPFEKCNVNKNGGLE